MTSVAASADSLLIERAQLDKEEFRLVYEKYAQAVYGYFVRRVGEKGTAEDLAQDTFLHAFMHLDGYADRGIPYLSYLFTVAHNILANHYRRKKELPLEELDELPGDDGGEIPKATEAQFDAQRVWNAALDLTVRERRVFFLKYWKERRVKEIAHATRQTENAVKLALSRGRRKLILHPLVRRMRSTSQMTLFSRGRCYTK